MNKKKFLVLLITISSVVFLAGCQNSPSTEQGNPTDNTFTTPVKPALDQTRGIPYSNGPTSAPNVKSPTAPPPQAQAVTKNENIKLSLPLKVE